MKCIYVLIFSCVILFSCHKSNRYGHFSEPRETIQIFDNMELKNTLALEDFFSEVELIPLETTPDAVLGNPTKLVVSNSNFFIHNKQQNSVSVFNKNGELVFSSKHLIGKGPNEYMVCGNYTINQYSGNLMILDHFNYAIKEFSFDGILIKQINIPKELVGIHDFKFVSDKLIIFYSNSGFQSQDYSLILFDVNKEEIINRFASLPAKRLQISTVSNNLYFLNDTLHLNHSFPSSPYTYYIDNRFNLCVKYKYNFGFLDFTIENVGSELDKRFLAEYYLKYAIVFEKYENNSHVYVSFFHKESSGFAIFDKEKKVVGVKINQPDSHGMLLSPHYVDNQYIYYLTMPEHVKNIVSLELLSNSQKELLESIKHDDNYVIIKYKLII